MTATSPPVGDKGQTILHRIKGEYFEMPGLMVTPSQAQRLLGVPSGECEILLEQLVAHRFLRRTPAGAFIKA